MAKSKTHKITPEKEFKGLTQAVKLECKKLIKLKDTYKTLEIEKQIQQGVLDKTQDPKIRQDATKQINKIDKQLKTLSDEIANERKELDCLNNDLNTHDQQLDFMQNMIIDRKHTLSDLHIEISNTEDQIDTLFQQPSSSHHISGDQQFHASAPQPYPVEPPSYFDSVTSNSEFQPGCTNNSALDQQEPAPGAGIASQLYGTVKGLFFHLDHSS